ncbi:MAG: gliding motility-associated ABC transporter substrate-binding protein GldG [Lewinellaceae bacterium]|nr:gliding motility-associated ABC transporter substrate-binding protein GldG [Phaeodactylibacter sp.]MCB9038897.1 gliding motility-associated ABC transporter substrate-binding protein GldG [Lewinellaceae bacterium]
MSTQKNTNNRKAQSLLQLLLFAGVLLFLNILANARIGGRALYAAVDMTEEQRYTLTGATRNLLENLDDVVYVKVLLEGDFPAGFKRLQAATRDVLDDFRSASGYIEYEFEDPGAGTTEQVNQRREQLSKDGVNPINLRVKGVEGTSEKLIYPYAVIYYKNRNFIVNLLENEMPGVPPEVTLNNSVGLLEYKLANAIQKLQLARKPNIVFTSGQGELNPMETADLEKSLREFYETGRVNLDSVVSIGPEAAALIIAKPTLPFSEKNKFKIDQYIMGGGKVLWLLDKVAVSLDSLRGRQNYYPNEYDLNLDDMLFKYGLRIQPDLVLDIQCSTIPLATGMVGNAPQFDYFRYPYHLVVAPQSNHPVVKSLGAVNLLYASSIDTSVQTKTGVEKTVLLQSSRNTRVQLIPVEMNFEFLRYDLDPTKFDQGPRALALALEGVFPSVYENRVTASMLDGLNQLGLEFRPQSEPTRMIVVSDGDVAKNKINPSNQSFSPLGYNEFDRFLFANKDLLLNSLEYLLDDNGVIAARGKEVRLRLLDTVRAKQESAFWQLLNIGLPLAFLAVFGLFYNWVRRRRFAG